MKNICKKCERQVVMHAFSFGNCELCNEEISTPHIPSFSVCLKCAEENDLCEQCGCKIEKEFTRCLTCEFSACEHHQICLRDKI